MAGKTIKILLVEDNATNQKVAAKILERLGCWVSVADNGSLAVDRLAEGFDVVFMDCHMPVMDGFEATAAIRKKEQGSELHQPVIALTAHAMKGDRERCLAAGMDGYLSKPIRAAELDEVLETYVTHRTELARSASAAGPV